jgi:hypothetical protein
MKMALCVPNHRILIFASIIALASCGKAVKPSAQKVTPKTFASPSEAGAALLAAAQSGDQTAFFDIFGPEGAEVLFTGDPAQDKAGLRDFVNAYTRMNRWGKIKAGGQTLYIGPDNYAFPIPLGQNSSGQWYFDTAAGKDEILARRIGKNELTAIAACEATANAEKQYFGETHDGAVKRYAEKLVSDPGKQNGLYWVALEGQPPSPLSRLGDFAKVASQAGEHPLFNGYYYRILAKRDGFAIVAYPAEYRNSGIMTFLVGKDGVVYQRDLGEKTRDVASGMTEFNRADGWSPAMPHDDAGTQVQ